METTSERRIVDIRALASIIRVRHSLFFATMGAVFLVAVLYLHMSSPRYTVSMQVAPVGNDQSQVGGGLGGLAKLAGVDLNSANPGAAQFRLFLSALTARDAADLIARDQGLMKAMFPKQWSQSKNLWRQPPSLVRPVAHTMERLLGFPVHEWRAPDGEDVQQFISDNLEIYEDPKSPVVTLRLDSDQPEIARRLLIELVYTVDQMLRQRALKRATDYVGYLSHELSVETVSEYRQTLMAHLAEQEQTLMMANAGVSFSMQVFNQPSIPRTPSVPKVAAILITALVFGMGLGAMLCLLAELRGWAPLTFSSLGRIGFRRAYVNHNTLG